VILAASPELAAVTASVRAFAATMTERCGRKALKRQMYGRALARASHPAVRGLDRPAQRGLARMAPFRGCLPAPRRAIHASSRAAHGRLAP
jgi:hypothetical protein